MGLIGIIWRLELGLDVVAVALEDAAAAARGATAGASGADLAAQSRIFPVLIGFLVLPFLLPF